jgi:DnaK suppressor protein
MAKSGDDGDRSVTISAEDVNFTKLARKRASIRMIEEALLKLDRGSYGICEECGDEIPEGRLMVMPFALHCRGCQELIEERQRVEGSTFNED